MTPAEGILFWISIVLYTLATAMYIHVLVFGNERVEKPGRWVLYAGFVLHTAAIGIRWVATGHIPTIGNYENASFSAWGIIVFTIAFTARYPALNPVGALSIPAAVFTMGFGVMSNPTLSPMVASLKSWWLYIHIIFAMLAYGAFFVAMATAILYLLKGRAEKAGKLDSPLIRRLPPLKELDEIILKNVIYGFIAYAGMIGSGALWGKNLWGSYWRWDPVETWSLISWLMYGAILHLRITMGWRGPRFCWLVIIAVPSVLLVFWGVNFAVESSLHIFNVR